MIKTQITSTDHQLKLSKRILSGNAIISKRPREVGIHIQKARKKNSDQISEIKERDKIHLSISCICLFLSGIGFWLSGGIVFQCCMDTI